jgi:LysM repeat protein
MKPFRSILPLLLVAPAAFPLVSAIASNPKVLGDPSDLLPLVDSASGPLDVPQSSSSGDPVSATETATDPTPAPAESDPLAIKTSTVATDATLLALEPSASSRRAIPAPPDPVNPSAVVRLGDTLLKISQRYGITISELLRLNPGLDTARLVVGSQIQVARSSPGRSRMLLGLAPVGSGGLSWPELPQFGEERKGAPSPLGGSFLWPAEGIFTSGYGWRWGRMHKGIDISNNVGTPIKAAAAGQVTFAGWHDGGYGYLVEITHSDGTLTRYAHNSMLLVREGEAVDQGAVISRMGSTGRSTGPHLHFEVVPPGQGAMNPLLVLPPRA